MKLNIGSGDIELEGYTAIDRKFGTEAYPLDIDTESCDEVRASHILEHFSYLQMVNVVTDWVRVLKPGGWLRIAVPDFHEIVKGYLRGVNQNTIGYVMGGQTDENDYHKSIYDRHILIALMTHCGLVGLVEWEVEEELRDTKDCSRLPISLNIKGRKPDGV